MAGREVGELSAVVELEAARRTMIELLARRGPFATLCPSEVARTLVQDKPGGGISDWRDVMPIVHAATDQLLLEGMIDLSWKRAGLTSRMGPYRIRRRDVR